MSEELKPCPFCGGPAELRQGGKFASCKNTQYWWSADYPVEYWNTRPIEDALQAELKQAKLEIARLRNALSKCDPWILDESGMSCVVCGGCYDEHLPGCAITWAGEK